MNTLRHNTLALTARTDPLADLQSKPATYLSGPLVMPQFGKQTKDIENSKSTGSAAVPHIVSSTGQESETM